MLSPAVAIPFCRTIHALVETRNASWTPNPSSNWPENDFDTFGSCENQPPDDSIYVVQTPREILKMRIDENNEQYQSKPIQNRESIWKNQVILALRMRNHRKSDYIFELVFHFMDYFLTYLASLRPFLLLFILPEKFCSILIRSISSWTA